MASTLRHRPFAILWSGQALSSIGDCLYAVTIASLMLQRGASPGEMGLIMSARAVGTVSTALIGGVLADRLSPTRVMLMADVGRAATMMTLALTSARIPLLAVAALTFLVGIGESVFRPAYLAVMPSVAPPQGLQSANALTSMAQQAAQVAGPVIAGLVVAAWSPQGALMIDSFTFMASIVTLSLIVRRIPRPAPSGTGRITRAELAAGWNEIRSHPWLAATTAGSSAHLLVGLAPLLLILPWLGKQYAAGTTAYAVLMTGFGVGSVLGAIASTRITSRRRGLLGQLGLLATTIAMLAPAVRAPLAAAIAAMALCGAGYSLFGVIWTTAFQQQVPTHLLGRVAAVDTAIGLACMPLGYLLGGAMGDALGERTTLFALAPITACCALLPLLIKGTTTYTSPSQPTAAVGRADLQSPA